MKIKTYRFRRFVAGAIDWNLSCLPAFLVCLLLFPLVAEGKFPIPLLIPIILSFPVLFLFREQLFKGRSLGNRLMKLIVLDRRNLQPLSASALRTRNLMFLFLNGLEILLLLATGATLGDRAVEALVVREDEIPAESPQRTSATARTILVTVLAVILGIALLVGIVMLSLESVKDEPHYALAYEYLISSDAYAQLDAQEDQIRLRGYSYNSTVRNGVAETAASFTFLIDRHQMVVTCHLKDECWYVCTDCTNFR